MSNVSVVLVALALLIQFVLCYSYKNSIGLSHYSHVNSRLSSRQLRGHNIGASKDVVNIHEDIVRTKLPVMKSDNVLKFIMNKFTPKSVLTLGITLLSTILLTQQPVFASPAGSGFIESILSKSASDNGFIQAFLLIFISEIGDKTFFIAGLLAAKYGKLISFTGSIGALAIMTIISTVLGQLFHAVPSSLTQGVPFDDYIAVAAFAYFGIKTLYEASKQDASLNSGIEEEKAEAEKTVEELTLDQKRKSAIALVIQTFSLVFAAEIGDRSFLSTIALSAALNPFAVASGAIAAHASATGIAVIGGSFLSKYLSEQVIGYIGGSLFLVFAITTALGVF